MLHIIAVVFAYPASACSAALVGAAVEQQYRQHALTIAGALEEPVRDHTFVLKTYRQATVEICLYIFNNRA